MKYIYGPVSSWRLGRSLGIDLISGDKTCSFDCIYCQVGKTLKYSVKRETFVPTAEILKEFDALPKLEIDYVTFSGCGEPTLASNLGEVISEIKKRTKTPLCVLTNSALLKDPSVRKELGRADMVLVKLDAPNEEVFRIVNKPASGVKFADIMEGITKFRSEFPEKLSLQIMFVEENRDFAEQIAELAKKIKPKKVYLSTPLRESKSEPLTKQELLGAKAFFAPLDTFCIYDIEAPNVMPLDKKGTEKRRPGGQK